MLMNYVSLQPGIPLRMHFTDDYFVNREISDPESGRPKRINTLVFWVDTLEGEPAARTFSVTSQKLQNQLEPFLRDKRYLDYDFIITAIGEGFRKDFVVEPILRRE